MLFNDPIYILFLAFVYLVYWALPLRLQNLFLLSASYYFYSCWNYRILPIIVICSLSSFLVARLIFRTEPGRGKKALLIAGLLVNFSFLFVFKYYDFFIQSFVDLLSSVGMHGSVSTLNLILPVGISFFTFQSASYVLDVYYGRVKPSSNVTDYFLYIAFFPQLVAGPIEKATTMLPQFSARRSFTVEKAREGLVFILYGLIKKLLVADRLALYVDRIYASPADATGIELVLASVFFAFQIYCDFSAYSDIALGSGKLLGFDLSRNFHFPYFSPNPSEFWRRWHMTLMIWFRDYVYIPMGGGKLGEFKKCSNLMTVFLLSGLWHGANWTFVIWGGINGMLLILHLLAARIISAQNTLTSFAPRMLGLICCYVIITLAWVFFRSDDVGQALFIVGKIVSEFATLEFYPSSALKQVAILLAFLIVEFVVCYYPNIVNDYVLAGSRLYVCATATTVVLLLFGIFKHVPFIYFQF